MIPLIIAIQVILVVVAVVAIVVVATIAAIVVVIVMPITRKTCVPAPCWLATHKHRHCRSKQHPHMSGSIM